MHRVVGLIAKQVVAIDLAIPAQIFGRGPAPYAWTVCAPGGPGATVPTENGFDVVAPRGLDALEGADTVIVPGIGDDAWPMPGAVLEGLEAAADRGARVASICTGAFVLAAAGLLDGRRATTHWRYAGLLARSFPNVIVDPDVLFVDDGDVLTSAGVAAGIDLCLHLVRADHGADTANAAVARRIVVAGHRDGGQSQFVERPLPAEPGGGLAATRAWMERRLAEPLTVEAMAAHAGYSPRSFARRFVAETGTTPLQWLIARRVSEAQRLLEGTDLGIDAVADACGLGSAPALRVHFGRIVGTTPTAYRRAFRGAEPRTAAA